MNGDRERIAALEARVELLEAALVDLAGRVGIGEPAAPDPVTAKWAAARERFAQRAGG